jgi:hypothetical protein
MPEHEARVRAFYDHEAEEFGTGRRRRQVADWGVGDDVFDRLPSRRFSRADGAHPRRSADSTAPPERAPVSAVEPTAEPAASKRAALAPPPRRAGRRRADVPRGGVEGRRTIVIGEPREEEPEPPRRARHVHSARRRPPRSAVERVGARPDRIVAYAVGLGLLLILIAILSAGH